MRGTHGGTRTLNKLVLSQPPLPLDHVSMGVVGGISPPTTHGATGRSRACVTDLRRVSTEIPQRLHGGSGGYFSPHDHGAPIRNRTEDLTFEASDDFLFTMEAWCPYR